MWVTFILIVCIFLLLVIYDNYLELRCKNIYTSIDNDNDITHAKSYLSYARAKYKRTALDNYRIGNMYDFVLHDQENATNYYKEAIKEVDVNDNQTTYIRDRIRDRIRINNDVEDDDNQYNMINLIELAEAIRESEKTVEQSLYSRRPIETHITYINDAQNVHDSNINNNIRDQFNHIHKFNTNNDVVIWQYPTIIEYLDQTYRNAPETKEVENINDAVAMLKHISKYDDTISKINMKESAYIEHIFSRIMAERDESKRSILLENLVANLKECYSGSNRPVCTTGRLTRVMTSFADIYGDGVGVLKTIQVVKNEIYAKSASIRDRILEQTSPGLLEKYNDDIKDDEVIALIDQMKAEVNTMLNNDYAEFIQDDKILQEIRLEIYATF
jgi:hypothetical protein